MKKFGSKKFCLPVKTSYPPVENVNETPAESVPGNDLHL